MSVIRPATLPIPSLGFPPRNSLDEVLQRFRSHVLAGEMVHLAILENLKTEPPFLDAEHAGHLWIVVCVDRRKDQVLAECLGDGSGHVDVGLTVCLVVAEVVDG